MQSCIDRETREKIKLARQKKKSQFIERNKVLVKKQSQVSHLLKNQKE